MPRKTTVTKLGSIIPSSDPAMLRMSGAELKAAAKGETLHGGVVPKGVATRAKAELERRAANKATKKANAAKLAK